MMETKLDELMDDGGHDKNKGFHVATKRWGDYSLIESKGSSQGGNCGRMILGR